MSNTPWRSAAGRRRRDDASLAGMPADHAETTAVGVGPREFPPLRATRRRTRHRRAIVGGGFPALCNRKHRFRMITLDAALAAYASTLRTLESETLAVGDTAGRVLAAPIVAASDLPRFDQSAMDGYAFAAAATAAASAETVVELPITLTLAAGTHTELAPVPPGAAARILTGAPLPPGADTVIPQERVQRSGDRLQFNTAWPAGRNIRRRGEELRAGSRIADAGQRISPGLLASLINGGASHAEVHRRPRVRVLVSGDELRPAGSTLLPGQTPDSNGPLVRAMLQRWGYAAPPVSHVADDEAQVRRALGDALQNADLVISTGGASVGDRDFLPAAAAALGLQRIFWKVAQRPGKPMYYGVGATGSALLALPGNPGAVLIGLLLHVRSVLDVLEGQTAPGPRWRFGRLQAPVEPDRARVRLMRMQRQDDADGCPLLTPLPHQDSHMLSNLSLADVLAWIPSGETPLAAGSRVRWLELDA